MRQSAPHFVRLFAHGHARRCSTSHSGSVLRGISFPGIDRWYRLHPQFGPWCILPDHRTDKQEVSVSGRRKAQVIADASAVTRLFAQALFEMNDVDSSARTVECRRARGVLAKHPVSSWLMGPPGCLMTSPTVLLIPSRVGPGFIKVHHGPRRRQRSRYQQPRRAVAGRRCRHRSEKSSAR